MRPRILLFVPLLLAGCARAEGEQDSPTPPPFVLTADEIRMARQLSEEHLGINARPLSPIDHTYFIKVELLPESQADTPQRRVVVTHYRYLDDETVHTMIDLNLAQVTKVEKFHHHPTGLAKEEVQRAEELARANDQLRTLMKDAQPPIRLQVRPIQFADPAEAFFGHRVVQVMLLQGDGELRSPRVLVDLHTETTHLEVIP